MVCQHQANAAVTCGQVREPPLGCNPLLSTKRLWERTCMLGLALHHRSAILIGSCVQLIRQQSLGSHHSFYSPPCLSFHSFGSYRLSATNRKPNYPLFYFMRYAYRIFIALRIISHFWLRRRRHPHSCVTLSLPSVQRPHIDQFRNEI